MPSALFNQINIVHMTSSVSRRLDIHVLYVMFKIIAFLIMTLFARLYVRVNMLLIAFFIITLFARLYVRVDMLLIAFFIITLFARLYVRVGMLLIAFLNMQISKSPIISGSIVTTRPFSLPCKYLQSSENGRVVTIGFWLCLFLQNSRRKSGVGEMNGTVITNQLQNSFKIKDNNVYGSSYYWPFKTSSFKQVACLILITVFAQLYVRVGMLLTWGKNLHDRIID
jgi:hypothetical protein